VTAKTPVAAAPTPAWRNRITGTGEEAPDQLLANPTNWRIHPRGQQDAPQRIVQALFEQMEVLGANHVWLYASVEAGGPGLGSRDERLLVPGGSA
jgi:hypothetical protein